MKANLLASVHLRSYTRQDKYQVKPTTDYKVNALGSMGDTTLVSEI